MHRRGAEHLVEVVGAGGGSSASVADLHVVQRPALLALPGSPRPARALTQVARVTSTRRRRRPARRYWAAAPLLLALDALAFVAAVLLTGRPTLGHLPVLGLVVALYAAAGHYRWRLSLSLLDDVVGLSARAMTAAALVTALHLLAGGGAPEELVQTGLALAVLAPLARAVGYRVLRQVRARGTSCHPTLVLGAGEIGNQLAGVMLQHPEYGMRPVGFVDDAPLLRSEDRVVPVVAKTTELGRVIDELGVRDVVVAFCAARETTMVDLLRTCDRLDCEIYLVPRLFELSTTSRDMDHLWGIPLVRMRRAAFRSPLWRLKRLTDAVLAAVALVLLAPVLTACAVAVRLEGGRGVLFRQLRVGLDGRPFELLKFRSLRPVDDHEAQTTWNISHDGRLGPVGRLLRQTSLDELPQLWNVLRGDMTLVGPRPERPHFVEAFQAEFPRYTARHRVPAGLTGWAQVHGLRGDTSIADRARFDNYYIENWSLWNDVKIMCRTVTAVVQRSGG